MFNYFAKIHSIVRESKESPVDHYKVSIPILSKENVVDAYALYIPGLYFEYEVGATVWVGNVDNNPLEYIIFGQMSPSGQGVKNLQVEHLEVNDGHISDSVYLVNRSSSITDADSMQLLEVRQKTYELRTLAQTIQSAITAALVSFRASLSLPSASTIDEEGAATSDEEGGS